MALCLSSPMRISRLAQQVPSEEPAAKKLCSEGQPSAAASPSIPAGAPSAPQPNIRASSSGSSAATTAAPARAPSSSGPRAASASRVRPSPREPVLVNDVVNHSAGLAPTVRYRNLRRHRTTVGAVLQSLTRNTHSLVDVIFPDSPGEEVRAAVLARISHSFSWPTADDARVFRGMFPITVRLANNRSVEAKAFSDPHRDFTTARSRGDTHLVLRNVPLGYSPEHMRETLLAGRTESGLPWLADLRLFHRLKDPYDGSAYAQLLGLPVAAEGDLGFDRIPAVLWIPDQEEPVLMNISSHSWRLIGQQAAPVAFKKDPGLLLIGVDLDVEVWTCVLCDFDCGLALDSAMYHIASDVHRNRMQESAHLPAAKDKYGAWKAATLLQLQRIAAFLHEPSPDRRLLTLHVNFFQEQLRLLAAYAPATPTLRRQWWRAIFALALDSPTASVGTILAGDFNTVCAPEDRNRPLLGHEISEGLMLSSILNNNPLHDTFRLLHPTTTMFSFFSHPRSDQGDSPPSASRLDRIYVTASLDSRLLDASYIAVSTDISDHELSPSCTIKCESPNVAPRPWRLPHGILKRPHLAQLVSSAYQSLPSSPSGDHWDVWKLDLCNKIKSFASQEKIRVKKTTSHLSNLLCQLRIHMAVNPSDEVAKDRLRITSQQFERYEAARSAELAMKAKLKVEGPREMGVSSLLVGVNSRIKASLISSLRSPSGVLTSNLYDMNRICFDFFQKLYDGSQPVAVDPSFWSLIPPSQLPQASLSRLALPFSLAEVSRAISSLPRGKTPAPAIHEMLLNAHQSLPPSMLQGRTVLIPKKGDASLVDNLRPITLMNTDYKILAICLANRLQPLLPSLINHSQTAFIKSRKIGDTLNDTLDIFDWASTQSIPLLALTVDIRKAYDLVDRDFLLSCLAHLGLPHQFIRWVKLMHTGTTTRISVNNLCGQPIQVRSGVRQGCPLAPLLFLCVIEIFHRYASCFLPGSLFHARRAGSWPAMPMKSPSF
ncbi:unnamed protein product [Closterium sp. Yama58-4]|nr:unnamed protein product [Closterium sp. Yama58-4]